MTDTPPGTVELDPRKHRMGLYDSATGRSIGLIRVVDITKRCSGRGVAPDEHVYLLFGRSIRGRVVNIRIENPEGGTFEVNFFVDERPEKLDRFQDWAVRRLGLRVDELSELIHKLAPA